MNKYGIILMIITGLFFLSIKLTWLGFTFLTIAMFIFMFGWFKKNSKEIWREFSKAETTDGTPTLKKYVNKVSKISAEALTRKEGTQYQLTSPTQVQKGLKSFFEELKNTFK